VTDTTTERRYGRRPVSERRAERRAKLLAAALDGFGTAGYVATSVEQLCAAAGCSTRSFYEEFPNREAVLIELHDALNGRAFDAVVTAVASVGATDDRADVARRVAAGVRAYLEVMTADPRQARIALVESVGVSPAADAARRAAIDRFAGFLEAEAERLMGLGLVEARRYDLTARAIVGAMNELVSTWPDQGAERGHLDALVTEATRLILAVLR
jgi:AcrR family transcriptional regulator